MRRSARVVTAVLGAGAVLVSSAPAALAQTATDTYSGVKSGTNTRSGAAPSTLPFTGGESGLAAAAGAGALLAGVALVVVAGRRRSSPDLPA